MNQFSTGVTFAWELAAGEAANNKSEFIEKEHIFIGIFSLEKLFTVEGIKEKIGVKIKELEPEYFALEDIAKATGLEMTKLRRAVRSMLHEGSHMYKEKVIHRSQECKDYFQRAEELGAGSINTLTLLAAILEKPGEIIRGIIEEYNLSVEVLKEETLKKIESFKEMPIKEEEKISTTKEKNEFVWLMRYGRDLVKEAKAGKLLPVEGRKEEMLQLVRTLSRKTKNNPVLIGEAGVGKTAIVEGLAERIAEGKSLKGAKIIELSIASLVAGTKYRGEFEERLNRVIEEAKRHPEVILFLDEIHNLVGAGRAEGTMDAADILKPVLARGEVKCIGATTIADYRRYIEKDTALERRFQPIMVNEPSAEQSIKILQRLKPKFESHHNLKILDEAITKAVEFSMRYLPHRQLPDKAVDIIDEACAVIKIPVSAILADESEGNLSKENEGLVGEEAVAKVVSRMTNIPVGKLTATDKDRLLNLEQYLTERVKGQEKAVKTVAGKIRLAKMAMKDKNKPLAVFLFLGPTGVGKTLLAKSIAQVFFGSEKELIRVDMSEYQEKHAVSKLIGAPPGYIGYEEEGQFTGKLRSKPYSVVLLDEIEKAHPEVLDIFLQLFDEGRITDSKGRTIDAKNAIFIMTSNIAPSGAKMGFKVKDTAAVNEEENLSELRKVFRPEFLNRIDNIIVFKRLSKEEIRKIINQQLNIFRGQILKEYGISLSFSEGITDSVVELGFGERNGAREIQRTIDQLIKEPLSEYLLRFQEDYSPIKGATVRIECQDKGIKISCEAKSGLPTQPPDTNNDE